MSFKFRLKFWLKFWLKLPHLSICSFFLLSCSRAIPESAIREDRTPRSERTVRPDVTLTPAVNALMLFHGKAIERISGEVKHTYVDAKEIRREDSYQQMAYLLTKAGELRAYDMKTHELRWNVRADCALILATQAGAICAYRDQLLRYANENGVQSASFGTLAHTSQLLLVGQSVFAARSATLLEVIDPESLHVTKTVTLKVPVYGSRVEPGFKLTNQGVCAASGYSGNFHVMCLNAKGDMTWEKSFSYMRTTDKSPFFIMLRQLDDNFAVASTWFGGLPRRGIVINMRDQSLVALLDEQFVSAFAQNDGSLHGILVSKPTTKYVRANGTTIWSSPVSLLDAASAIFTDSSIAIATYHPISSGADLLALDAQTGTLKWRSNIELHPVAHSKYANRVTLAMVDGKLHMRGIESSQDYLQIVAPNDGKLLLGLVR